MFRLESLLIKNFRGIREGQIEGLADVSVLVGRNNSGKTTVIEAITRVATSGGLVQDLLGRNVDQFWQLARSALPFIGGFPVQMLDARSLLYYRQGTSQEIRIVANMRENGAPTDELTYMVKGGVMLGAASLQQRAPTHSPNSQLKQAFCTGVTVFRPADAFNAAIEQKFWPELLSDRRDRLLTKTLNEVFGLDAESFQLLPNNQFTVLLHDFSLPLDVLGDGTRAAMRTLMTLSMLKGTLFMIEEPECHQHPGSLERFAGALCRLAKAQSVQVIVSTHSAECVRAFLQAANSATSNAAVFHLSLDEGKQEARRLDPDAVETLTNTGVDVRFLDLYA